MGKCRCSVIALLLHRWGRLCFCKHTSGWFGQKPDELQVSVIKRKPSSQIPASQNEAQTGCDLTLCGMWRGWSIISETGEKKDIQREDETLLRGRKKVDALL